MNGEIVTDFTGNGLILNAGALSLDVVNSNVATGSSASYSGLEFIGNQLTLLRGCSDGEGLFWNSGTGKWECLLPTGVGGVGDITKVGDITSGEAFSAANPGGALYFRNDSFLGLGSSAARITFTDSSTDTISLLDAYV